MKNIIAFVFLLIFYFNCSAQSARGVTVTAVPDSASGKTWAVIVGVSSYKNISGLNYADRDAHVFYDYLTRTTGGPKLDTSCVKLLLNENAISSEIYGALDWLSGNVKQNDRVIFYFSGHGDVERKTISQNGFLLAYDAPRAAYMTNGTISIKYLQDYLQTYIANNKAKDVILIADACHSGKLAGGTEGVKLTIHALGENWDDRIIKILSAQEGELSYEDKKWGGGRGVFSYYLMKGIEGLAARNNDSLVTTVDLKIFLDRVVGDATGNVQNPEITGNPREALFKYNSKLIVLAKQDEPPGGPMLAAAGRGTTDELQPYIQALYAKYLTYLKEKKLLWGANETDTINCARHIYLQLTKDSQALNIKSSVRSSFIAALQHRMQNNLDNYLKGKLEIDDYHTALLEVNYLDKITDQKYILHDYIKARLYFLESLYSKDKTISIGLLKKTLQLEPEAPYALNEMGFDYYSLSHLDSAVYYYEKALKVSPQWAYPYNNIGVVCLALKDYDKAELCFAKAIELNEPNADFLYNLGRAHDGQKNYKSAILDYQLAIKIYPASIYFMNLGITYVYNKNYVDGITCLKDVLASNPQEPKNYYNLSIAYSLAGNKQNGLTYLETALAKGYKNYEHILTDPDLTNIKKTPEFKQLLKKYFPNQVNNIRTR